MRRGLQLCGPPSSQRAVGSCWVTCLLESASNSCLASWNAADSPYMGRMGPSARRPAPAPRHALFLIALECNICLAKGIHRCQFGIFPTLHTILPLNGT